MHNMLANCFGFDGSKCPKPNMQSNKTDPNSSFSNLVQHRLGEVESGGRRGDGAQGPRKDGLVTFPIRFHTAGVLAPNVRRQRDLSQRIQERFYVGRAVKLQSPMAFGIGFKNGGTNISLFSSQVIKDNFRSDSSPLSRTQHHPPIVYGV